MFEKFRLGKTYDTYDDPATGKPARKSIVRCSQCLAQRPEATDRPVGYETGAAFLEGMRSLTGPTARAERVLLTARRGGVETRSALLEIDAARGSPFEAKRDEGLKHAVAALETGEGALAELSYRRRGLVVALVFVVLVLIGLGLKIRDMSRRSDGSA